MGTTMAMATLEEAVMEMAMAMAILEEVMEMEMAMAMAMVLIIASAIATALAQSMEDQVRVYHCNLMVVNALFFYFHNNMFFH